MSIHSSDEDETVRINLGNLLNSEECCLVFTKGSTFDNSVFNKFKFMLTQNTFVLVRTIEFLNALRRSPTTRS